jgi:UDP-N-acetylmuramate--alanine ligase
MFNVKRLHFVGIGGVGMCGIAEVLLNLGYEVSGSDLKDTDSVARLRALGARVDIGHDGRHVEGASVVVYSSAVSRSNPEISAARDLGIPVIPRAEMLGELMRLKYGIAVSGSHGKTTTTSMIATILSGAGLDPTIVIGGRVDSMDSGARLGMGKFLVAEADESDGSFNKLSPTIAVITNIDREHMDHYGTIATLHEAFAAFANKVPFYGAAILCLDDSGCRAVLGRIERRTVTYGMSTEARIRAEGVELQGLGSSFHIFVDDQELAHVRLRVPGQHNVLNALAATGAALELDLPGEDIARGLEAYVAVDRRFQIRGEAGGVLVVDDYGHHPAEIAATLRAAKGLDRRILALFQPHRYSRTADLMLDFAGCFGLVEVLGVLDIYSAGERPIEGVTSAKLVEAIRERGHRNCRHFARKEEAVESLVAEAREGDMLLLLGAGDVNQLAPAFLESLNRKAVRTTRTDVSGVSGHAQHAPKQHPKGASDSVPQSGEGSW